MLRQVYTSEAISYRPPPPPPIVHSLLGVSYRDAYEIPLPWFERIRETGGVAVLWVHPAASPTSKMSYFLIAKSLTVEWPGWSQLMMRWDGITGNRWEGGAVGFSGSYHDASAPHPGRLPHFPNVGWEFAAGNGGTFSRNGLVYLKGGIGVSFLTPYQMSSFAKSSYLDDVAPAVGLFEVSGALSCFDFGLVHWGGATAVDERENRILHSSNSITLDIYSMSGQEIIYSLDMPEQILDICLEDERYGYVLLENRELVLIDYIRAQALGAVKIPPNPQGTVMTSGQIKIAWDPHMRRILVCEYEPDLEDGTPVTHVIGYNIIPIPLRLTVPVPLRVPRQGEIIPFHCQVVGDMNEGVGGYSVTATVSGSGSLAGAPVTDHNGNAIIQVACEANDLFLGDPNAETEGSPEADPPHAGNLYIEASVVVPVDPLTAES